jgi:PAS domain-containing protein
MKTEDQHHQQLIKGIALEYEEILTSSHQAIYIWLDEERMVCNSKFSTLLGYNSPEELSSQKGSFLDLFVAESDQQILANAYQNAMNNKTSSTFSLKWKKRSGGTVSSNVNLVPIVFGGHLFALHFID